MRPNSKGARHRVWSSVYGNAAAQVNLDAWERQSGAALIAQPAPRPARRWWAVGGAGTT